jgi:hypothetical protein
MFQRQDEWDRTRAWGKTKDPHTTATQLLDHDCGVQVR